ncbi:MAG: hypothetical protein KDA93_13545 [Planctomycetaceae bacterium]|nr:hypothetical protein [Planctomycetaceae bacterium]
MFGTNELRTDKFTLEDGTTSYVLTHLPSRISARDDDFDKPVMERLANIRKRLEVCVSALVATGSEQG